MVFPRFWWLLLLATLGQGLFLAVRGVLLLRGKRVQENPFPLFGFLAVGAGAGLAYGAVQSDPVFLLGQACIIILFSLDYLRNR